MPSDDGSKSQDSGDKGTSDGQGHLTKAIAAVFATVVAPVLVALGMKFSDVIVASLQPKPPEVAKAEPERGGTEKAEPHKSESAAKTATEPSKTDVVKVEPATTKSGENKTGSATASPGAEGRGKKRKKNLATGQPASTHETAGFASLFNGRDLSGWGSAGAEIDRWFVDANSNILAGRGGKKQGNWLFSDKVFSDFRLRLEFRMAPDTESGIAFHTPPLMNVKEGRMAIRLTTNENDPNPTGTFVTWSGGTAFSQSDRRAAVSLKPGKEWNLVEIEFHGPHLIVTINGQAIQDVRVDELPSKGKASAGLQQKKGRIGLESRSGNVEFRKIEIQELD